MLDPYVYPHSEVLKNKFNISNEKDLNEMEAEYTSLRIRELVDIPIKGNFDFKHFCMVHQYIFQDIYDWAGSPRTVDIEKPEYLIKIVKDSMQRGLEVSPTMSMDEWKGQITTERQKQQDLHESKPSNKGRDR